MQWRRLNLSIAIRHTVLWIGQFLWKPSGSIDGSCCCSGCLSTSTIYCPVPVLSVALVVLQCGCLRSLLGYWGYRMDCHNTKHGTRHRRINCTITTKKDKIYRQAGRSIVVALFNGLYPRCRYSSSAMMMMRGNFLVSSTILYIVLPLTRAFRCCSRYCWVC